MTKREFALLAVRLLALFVMSTPWENLGWMFWLFTIPGRPAPSITMILLGASPFYFQISFGVLLWLYAKSIARFIASETGEQLITNWQPRDVVRLGLVLVGLLSLLHGVELFGQALGQISLALGGSVSGSVIGVSSEFLRLLTGLPPVVFGLVLILGARVLSYWLAPREVRSEEPKEPDGQT